jgi:taurine dioxygenase
MEVEQLSAPLGAIVTGVDIRTVNQSIASEINKHFCQYHVLVFPGQKLTPDQQIEFARYWGELVAHPYSAMPDYPNLIELKNGGKKRDVNQHWHSDMTYNVRPPKLTMLYALEAPKIGGETAFANQVLAYQELSDGLKKVLDELTAFHSAGGLAKIYGEDSGEAPNAEHPLVRVHDETGEKSLYVCRAFTKKIVGWSMQESRAMLNFLFEHSIRPEFQARHQWRPEDLVMWDNRCLLHYAVHDHGDDPRVLHRLQVIGEA